MKKIICTLIIILTFSTNYCQNINNQKQIEREKRKEWRPKQEKIEQAELEIKLSNISNKIHSLVGNDEAIFKFLMNLLNNDEDFLNSITNAFFADFRENGKGLSFDGIMNKFLPHISVDIRDSFIFNIKKSNEFKTYIERLIRIQLQVATDDDFEKMAEIKREIEERRESEERRLALLKKERSEQEKIKKYKKTLSKIQNEVAYQNGLKLMKSTNSSGLLEYKIRKSSTKGNKGNIMVKYKWQGYYKARAAFGFLSTSKFCKIEVIAKIEVNLENLDNDFNIIEVNNCYHNTKDEASNNSFYKNLRNIASIVAAAGLVKGISDPATYTSNDYGTSKSSYSGYSKKKNNKRVIEINFIGNNRDVNKGTLCSRSANKYKIEFSDNSSGYIYQITEREGGCLGNLNDWIYKKSSWGAGMVAKTKNALIEKINKYYE